MLFEQDLAEQLQDLEFKAAYELQVAKTLAIATWIEALESEREAKHLTKADVGRRINRKRSAISRLFSGKDPNPTFDTLADALFAVGLQAEVKIKRAPKRAKKAEPVKVLVSL
jgi:transcriptional regulator with XRE-family HTH domain